MAKRVALSDDERRELAALRAERDARRRQWAEASRRYRHRQHDAKARHMTRQHDAPDLSARTHVRTRERAAPESVTTMNQESSPRAARAVPKPNKSAELIDALRAAGLPDVLSPRDHAAVKRTTLSPAQIVDVFGAAYRGEFGGDWLRENLALWIAIDRYPAYLASKQITAKRRPLIMNGKAIPPAAMQPNPNPDADLPHWDEEQAERSDAERRRVFETMPARLRGQSRWRTTG